MTELLTVDDVAQITGLSAYTIRAAVRAGELRGHKIRRRIRIESDDLAAWIDDCTVTPGTPDREPRSRGPIRPPRPAAPTGMSAREAIRAIRQDAA